MSANASRKTEPYPTGISTPEVFPTVGQVAYWMACSAPFAFFVMAMGYPPDNPNKLPAMSVQVMWWTFALLAPVASRNSSSSNAA